MAKTSENPQLGPKASIVAEIGLIAVVMVKVAALIVTGGLALLTLLILLFVGGLAAYFSIIPAYSADHDVEAVRTNVLLEFYMVWDETKEDGRYLTISSPTGRRTVKMCGFDWAHRSRTGLYLTEDNKLAVMGPKECDYIIVNVETLKLANVRPAASEGWTYLGAFQIVLESDYKTRKLRFIDASEQAECIEMAIESWSPTLPRNHARREDCQPPTQN
jgi:hypothetical protein